MIRLAQDPEADAVLTREPFVLLVGMLLDQQYPMERAFAGAARLHQRLGPEHGGLQPAAVSALPVPVLIEQCVTPPAVHRYPAAMARRISALAVHICDEYEGDTTAVWRNAGDGAQLRGRLLALPGFGPQKSHIFVALLGKQLGIQPEGWREAAGDYGQPGSYRSVADVVDASSLARVREFKQEQKRQPLADS